MLKVNCTVLFLLMAFLSSGQIIKVDTASPISANDKILQTLADTAFSIGYNTNDNDSIDPEHIFIANLLQILKSPKTFYYKFPLLNHSQYKNIPPDVRIVYANDSLFRIFNWLSPTTGTWHNFRAVFQARNKNSKILTSYPEANYPEGDLACTSYLNIYRLKSSTKQLYLCIGYGQGSGRLPFETVETYEVTNDSIKNANILPDSTMSSSIFVDRQATMYDNKRQDIPEIRYNLKKEVLIVPEIKGDYHAVEDVRWTGKYIRYKFNGIVFVKSE